MNDAVRHHYASPRLVERLAEALPPVRAGGAPLSVTDLAPLDQFHTRGLVATRELADFAHVSAHDAVLDIGCGVGGPARFLAATRGCTVTGIDLSAEFVDAAEFLTRRCALQAQARFHVGNALDLPFDAQMFDVVFLQHVAMNIADRARLYTQAHRVLRPGGRLAIYDVVHRGGEVQYPVPWAADASTSFLLDATATRHALESAGFRVETWRDDTETALAWFAEVANTPRTPGPSIAIVMGPTFAAAVANFARQVQAGRLGIVSAVLQRAS